MHLFNKPSILLILIVVFKVTIAYPRDKRSIGLQPALEDEDRFKGLRYSLKLEDLHHDEANQDNIYDIIPNEDGDFVFNGFPSIDRINPAPSTTTPTSKVDTISDTDIITDYEENQERIRRLGNRAIRLFFASCILEISNQVTFMIFLLSVTCSLLVLLLICCTALEKCIKINTPKSYKTSHLTTRTLNGIPTRIWTKVEGQGDKQACEICHDLYNNGDILRTLPCDHEFHMMCVDPCLLSMDGHCPTCKKLDITSSQKKFLTKHRYDTGNGQSYV